MILAIGLLLRPLTLLLFHREGGGGEGVCNGVIVKALTSANGGDLALGAESDGS